MLGIWVAPEEPLIVDGTTRVNSEQAAKNKINNKEQLQMAIRLAKDYGEFITAINVGNEIFVDWSWHRIDNKEQVFAVIDALRREVKVPLTIADDYSFWNKIIYGRSGETGFFGCPLPSIMEWFTCRRICNLASRKNG